MCNLLVANMPPRCPMCNHLIAHGREGVARRGRGAGPRTARRRPWTPLAPTGLSSNYLVRGLARRFRSSRTPPVPQQATHEELKQFLLENVESYEELGVLVWFHRRPSAEGTAQRIAEDARLPLEGVADALEKLLARRLLSGGAEHGG